MKRAIICPICSKPKKTSDSYAVKLTDYRLDKAIDYKLPTTGKEIRDRLNLTHKVRVCRTCTKRMGYKVKVAKPKGLKNGK